MLSNKTLVRPGQSQGSVVLICVLELWHDQFSSSVELPEGVIWIAKADAPNAQDACCALGGCGNEQAVCW